MAQLHPTSCSRIEDTFTGAASNLEDNIRTLLVHSQGKFFTLGGIAPATGILDQHIFCRNAGIASALNVANHKVIDDREYPYRRLRQ